MWLHPLYQWFYTHSGPSRLEASYSEFVTPSKNFLSETVKVVKEIWMLYKFPNFFLNRELQPLDVQTIMFLVKFGYYIQRKSQYRLTLICIRQSDSNFHDSLCSLNNGSRIRQYHSLPGRRLIVQQNFIIFEIFF